MTARDPLAALTPSQRRALASRQTDPRARGLVLGAPSDLPGDRRSVRHLHHARAPFVCAGKRRR